VRIACLSAEAAEICARLGAWDDVIAVSAFASQDGRPRRPVVGGFSTVDVERVAGLHPDLVITFSDVQADISAQLIRTGCNVLATNQRTLAGPRSPGRSDASGAPSAARRRRNLSRERSCATWRRSARTLNRGRASISKNGRIQ
jgi:ABC-type Fe3+-hydroxamate transport system substrate-binding protein